MILAVSGIVAILRKQYLWGVVLIIVGLLVGPGGVSVFTRSAQPTQRAEESKRSWQTLPRPLSSPA